MGMTGKKILIVGVMGSIVLLGCATPYQELTAFTMSGGYSAKQLEQDIYRVEFSANGYASRETAQTYWLFRCAELTLEKGYDGFEILSNINLVMPVTPELFFASDYQLRQAAAVYIPVYNDDSNKPYIQADIRLLRRPFVEAPPKVFVASKLRDALKPYAMGEKCSMGNVCEHVHRYLFPDNKFAPQSSVAPNRSVPVPADVLPVPPPQFAVGERVVAKLGARLMQRPTPQASVIRGIGAGASVELIARNDNPAGAWWFCDAKGDKGWVLESELEAAPAPAP